MSTQHIEHIEVDGIEALCVYTVEYPRITKASVHFWLGLKEYNINLYDCVIKADVVNLAKLKIYSAIEEREKEYISSFYGNKPLWRRVVNAIFKTNDGG